VEIGDIPALSDMSLSDHAFDLLKNTRTPEHYKIIARSQMGKGVFIPGKNSEASLLAHINRDDRFERVGRGTYFIKHPPAPPAQQ